MARTISFSAQEIAAAIIYLNGNKPMDYEVLKDLVIETGLTGLGILGSTPKKTLRTDLNKCYKRDRSNCCLFQESRTCCYNLRNENVINEFPRLKRAVEIVRKKNITYIIEDNKGIQNITVYIIEKILNKYLCMDKPKDIKDCIEKLNRIQEKTSRIQKYIETL